MSAFWRGVGYAVVTLAVFGFLGLLIGLGAAAFL